MLVLTGIMLGVVLLVMVGESVQEMQLAHWISEHDLSIAMPDWLGTWFAVFPNVEGLVAQVLAGVFVIGSYYLARRVCSRRLEVVDPMTSASSGCIVPDCSNSQGLPRTYRAGCPENSRLRKIEFGCWRGESRAYNFRGITCLYHDSTSSD